MGKLKGGPKKPNKIVPQFLLNFSSYKHARKTFSQFIVMEKAQQVKCSLPMIGNIVYGPLIRFEMEVNPIRHGPRG